MSYELGLVSSITILLRFIASSSIDKAELGALLYMANAPLALWEVGSWVRKARVLLLLLCIVLNSRCMLLVILAQSLREY